MDLYGYDASLELGRSALNKLLAGLEQSPLWTGTFQGRQEKPGPLGILARVQYKLVVSDIRVRPDAEQEVRLESSIKLLVNVDGQAIVDFFVDAKPMLHHIIELHGIASVVVNFELTYSQEVRRLVISFANATVQHVILRGLSDDVQRMLVNGVEFVLQAELRQHQQALPLTGLLALTGSPQGRLETLILKSHFYRLLPQDAAVGLLMTFEPGSAPETLRQPLKLTRLANQDLAVSIHEGYLNRVIANYLHESNPVQNGGPLFSAHLDGSDFHVRSVSLIVKDSAIQLSARAGWNRTEVSLQGNLVASMVNGHLALRLSSIRCDLPTCEGIYLKLILNVLLWALLGIADLIVAGKAREELKKIELEADGIAVDSKMFANFPEGLEVTSNAKSISADKGIITLGYELNVAWTK